MNANLLADEVPASLREIETTPPACALNATLWTLAALVAVLLAWSLPKQLDIAATAPGQLVLATQVKVAQSAEPGIVRAQLMEIRAPYDGIVKDLSVHALGHVVQAGQPLLQVVPKGEVLRAEALLANEDVGFVAVGQTVKLKLAAYPFQKYGMLEGRVAQISADAIEQALRLPNGRYLDIAPGMAATVAIHQGTRSVMEYLLSPVQAGGDGGRTGAVSR